MFSYKRIVTISECGPDRKMSVYGMMTALSDCEHFQNDNIPLVTAYCDAHRIGGFVAYRQADIVRMPACGEEIVVSSNVYELGSVVGHRHTLIESVNGGRLVTAYGLGVFVGIDTGKPSRIPAEIVQKFSPDPKHPMELLPRKIALPECAFAEAPAFLVTARFIDLNRHMNNVHYSAIAFDALSEPFCPARVRVEFKTAAKQGDTIRPLVYAPEESRRVVVLKGVGGTVYAIAEFGG